MVSHIISSRVKILLNLWLVLHLWLIITFLGDASARPTFWASRPGYEKAMISIEFKYHSTQKASHRIKRIFIQIFCGHVLELIAAGIFYGFLNTVEPLGTDTYLIRTDRKSVV